MSLQRKQCDTSWFSSRFCLSYKGLLICRVLLHLFYEHFCTGLSLEYCLSEQYSLLIVEWVARGSRSAMFFCTFFIIIIVPVCHWSIACLNRTACWLLNGLCFSDLFGGQNLLAAHSFLSLLNPSTFVTCLFIKNVHLKAVKAVGHLTNNN